MDEQKKEVLQMTAATIGRDLLQALVTEVRLLPDVWPKLPKAKQDDVIDRLRARVEHNVAMAVHLIAAQGRVVVTGDLDQVTIKDGVKAVVKFGMATPNLVDLAESVGQCVLLVVANASGHAGGMEEVTGEEDQRGLDLGHEYNENDGGGMTADEDGVIDGKSLRLPQPEGPTEEEKQSAFNAGYAAAERGDPREECPTAEGWYCIAWTKGWQSFHDTSGAGE